MSTFVYELVKFYNTQYKHPTKPNKVTVPHPKKDLPIGTLSFRLIIENGDRYLIISLINTKFLY